MGGCTKSLDADENEVIEILLNLPAMFLKQDSPFTWGHKKMRSAIRWKVWPSPVMKHQHLSNTVAATRSQTSPPLKEEASSPTTPLSLSPSEESDQKLPFFRRNVSLKRKRQHYLKMIEDATKDNNLLQGEIKNVKCHFDRLKNFNLKLKARKQELSHGPNQAYFAHQQPQSQFPGMAQNPPLIANQTATPPRMSDSEIQLTTSLGVASTSESALGIGNTNNNNNRGPIGIPDLNIPLEEQSMAEDNGEALDVNVNLDDKKSNRALAAEARQKRIQIWRFKNPIANSRMRYSYR